MTPITFKHGPVTITVEGLPESVALDAVHLEIGVHYSYVPADERDAAFIRDFAALGGTDTFLMAHPANRFSVRQLVSGVVNGRAEKTTSKLQLYAPTPDAFGGGHSAALAAALEAEEKQREAAERENCGRLLIGQGDDTYDPICSLPAGHDESCKP